MTKKRVISLVLGVIMVVLFAVSAKLITDKAKINDRPIKVLGVSSIPHEQKNQTKTINAPKKPDELSNDVNTKIGQQAINIPVWQEDFSTYTNSLPTPQFWNIANKNTPIYNQEEQIYENNSQNVRVENGNLVLEAHKNSNGITSGRVDTKGKVKITQGSRLEAIIKLPKGKGVWPAFWLLSDNQPYTGALNPTDADWQSPRFYMRDGEIDVMEYYGGLPGLVESTLHTFAGSHEKSLTINDNTFHTYWMEWRSDKIDFGVDNQVVFTVTSNSDVSKWPFTSNNHMYVIFNLAMGGTGGGQVLEAPGDIWRMEISSVKYYRIQ